MIRLKELRQKEDITQKELAKILNCTDNTISRYEIGDREPDYEILVKIANYFHVSTDYLLGNTDNPEPPDLKKEAPSVITTEEAIKILATEKFGLNPSEQDMQDLDLAMESAINALIQRKRKENK